MPGRTLRALAPSLALAAAGIAVAAPATQVYQQIDHAAGSCQPAREYPDLRVRQLEMDNIGTTNAYIVCAINPRVSNQDEGSNVSVVNVYFFNAGATAATIRCTLNDQWGVQAATASYRKELLLGPGQANSIAFRGSTDGGYPWFLTAAAVQCILPPDTSAMHVDTEYNYRVEVVQ